MKKAAHLSLSPEHGTPQEFIEIARHALGAIYVDPSSSAKWNARVGAHRFITKEEDGLITPWFPGAPAPNERGEGRTLQGLSRIARYTALVNPPGEPTGHCVARFWTALTTYYSTGWCNAAVWIGFNIEQLSRLQRVNADYHPLDFPTVIPAMRAKYVDGNGRPNDTPPHSSFITLVSQDPQRIERFQSQASKLGHVINRI